MPDNQGNAPTAMSSSSVATTATTVPTTASTTKPAITTTVSATSTSVSVKPDNLYTQTELCEWIDSRISGEEPSRRDKKALKKQTDENGFFTAWRTCLQEKLTDITYDYDVLTIIDDYCELYEAVWEESDNTSKSRSFSLSFSDELDAYYDSLESMAYYPENAEVQFAFFYVTDNVSEYQGDGVLKKIMSVVGCTDYNSTSCWNANNISIYSMYAYTSIPGDSEFFLFSAKKYPFSEAGSYALDYIDTGKTVNVIDYNGFSKDIPVYIIVDDADALAAKRANADELLDIASSSFDEYLSYLSGETSDAPSESAKQADKIQYIDAAPKGYFDDAVSLPYTVKTDGDMLNVREACDKNSEIIDRLDNGCDIEVLGIYNGWAYIVGTYGVGGFAKGTEYAEFYGWVNAAFIEVIPFSP